MFQHLSCTEAFCRSCPIVSLAFGNATSREISDITGQLHIWAQSYIRQVSQAFQFLKSNSYAKVTLPNIRCNTRLLRSAQAPEERIENDYQSLITICNALSSNLVPVSKKEKALLSNSLPLGTRLQSQTQLLQNLFAKREQRREENICSLVHNALTIAILAALFLATVSLSPILPNLLYSLAYLVATCVLLHDSYTCYLKIIEDSEANLEQCRERAQSIYLSPLEDLFKKIDTYVKKLPEQS